MCVSVCERYLDVLRRKRELHTCRSESGRDESGRGENGKGESRR